MAASSELRRRVIQLVASVIVLDAIALAIYYGGHIGDRSTRTQTNFVSVWMVVTLIVVLSGLQRVRAVRTSRGRRMR